ncbi:MAG: hypothetical protein IT367_16305 [Candidatus Hydrogenedentes bacterium]|nr:hypothetical protein [Candidatus Hydrogenedentota bacterium]
MAKGDTHQFLVERGSERLATQANSIQVSLRPPVVADLGGQWSVDGGPWHSSGDTQLGLVAGNHTVSFKAITGSWNLPGVWQTPTSKVVTLNEGQDLTCAFEWGFAQPSGVFEVILGPQAAVSSGAQWRLDNGPWLNSGNTTLVPYNPHPFGYKIEAKAIADWITPFPGYVIFTSEPREGYQFITYEPDSRGLRVTLFPEEANAAGAQWAVDGGEWQNSGSTVYDLSIGIHYLSFKPLEGWTAPNTHGVAISGEIPIHRSAESYSPSDYDVGTLWVSVEMQGFVNQIITTGQWRIDNGTWRSETLGGIPVGDHSLQFSTVWGWVTPKDQPVTIDANGLSSAYATYSQAGQLCITISPQEAIDAGAKWRRQGTAEWLDSGDSEGSLSPGAYTVEFLPITDWTTPQAFDVNLSAGQLTQKEGTYQRQAGQVAVVIMPKAARKAGARWRIDDDVWRKSSATNFYDVPVGPHTIKFKAIAGWSKPASISINVEEGGSISKNGKYTK